jgi:tetratricopeptide (TPR) repeat protein
MKTLPPIDPDLFVQQVHPMLENQNLEGLLHLLTTRWECEQIVSLLGSEQPDARKIAALALSFVGGKCCLPELIRALRDPEPIVNQMAEHALWSIWLKSGSPEANHQVARGTQATNRRDFQHALKHFSKAIEIDPKFAEAYDQRALINFLLEHYQESITDYHKAIELMPCHFGAWAGIGHCYLHLGQLDRALHSYERALEINPGLDCVRETVCELRRRVATT